MKGYFVVLVSMALLAVTMLDSAQSSEMPPCEAISARFVMSTYVDAKGASIESIVCHDRPELSGKAILRDCDVRLKGKSALYRVTMQVGLVNSEMTCMAPPLSSTVIGPLLTSGQRPMLPTRQQPQIQQQH